MASLSEIFASQELTPEQIKRRRKLALMSSGGFAGVPLLSMHARLVFEGDSITAGSSGPAYSQFAISRSRGRFYCPSGYNQATGGQTAAQMATQVANVTALSPKAVVCLSGTNDLSGTADTPATIFANQRTAVDGYKAAGARVVFICTLPRNDTTWTNLSAGRQADRTTLVNLQRAQTDVEIVDLESTFDPTTMCVDGLHPNYLGAITIGQAVGDKLNEIIVAGDIFADYLAADNYLFGATENPALTGTAGSKSGAGVTGEVANLWTVEENGGMTVVCSKTTLNGKTAQRVVVSGTNSTNGRVVNLRNTVTYSGQAGEFYETWFEFSFAAGAANVRAITASCDTISAINASASVHYPDMALEGVIRPPSGTALAGTDTSTNVQAGMVFSAGTVAADLILAGPYFRKVPAAQ